MRILAVLTVRNEGAFLLEWLAHHRAVGFTDFLVFSNNCQDGTDTMLDQLADMGLLTHIRNDGPYHKGGIQFTALNDASKMDIFKNADWILALDIDEFVNIHVGDHTIGALLAALPDATAITLTWRLFGNNDVVYYDDTSVTETFTHCAPVVMYWPWRAAMFKTLYRNDGVYRKLGVHRPRNPDSDRLAQTRWFDGQGRELDDQFKNRRLFSSYGRPNYQLVQLNHYALGAMESYVLKADRGRAVHSDHILGVDYWVERNFNTDVDDSIHDIAPQRSEIHKEICSNTDIITLHKKAVDWRKSRFQDLMKDEPFRALFARLLMTPPSRLVSLKNARALSNHARSGKT